MGDWIKPAGCIRDSTSPPAHRQFQQIWEEKRRITELCVTGYCSVSQTMSNSLSLLKSSEGSPNLPCWAGYWQSVAELVTSHRIMESLQLEKTLKIIKSNHQLSLLFQFHCFSCLATTLTPSKVTPPPKRFLLAIR